MGWEASVYVRGLKAAPDGSGIDWELRSFLMLLASFYDERRRVLRTTFDDVRGIMDRSERRVFGLFEEAVKGGILEKVKDKRNEQAKYRFTHIFTAIHDSQPPAEEATQAPPLSPVAVVTEVYDSQPPVSLSPISVATATHDSQLGTTQARPTEGIPKVRTEDSTDNGGAPPKRRRSAKAKLSPDLLRAVDQWRIMGHPSPISQNAAGELRKMLQDYKLDKVVWVIGYAAASGKFGAHQWMRTVLATEQAKEVFQGGTNGGSNGRTNGRYPQANGPPGPQRPERTPEESAALRGQT